MTWEAIWEKGPSTNFKSLNIFWLKAKFYGILRNYFLSNLPGTGLLEQLENHFQKRLYIFKPFRPLTGLFWKFWRKISEALSKRNCTPTVQGLRENFIWKYIIHQFFWISKNNWTLSRGYSTGCRNNILHDQRNILTKTFRKNAIFTELFLSVSKKLWSFR